jgi:hypothetical protein
MKKLTLITMLVTLSLVSFSQSHYTETIHLKNGTVVSGTIVEFAPNKTYTIVTADGNKFVFDIEDVVKITRSLPEKKAKSNSGSSANFFSTGYQGSVETGFGTGMGTYGVNMFKLDIVNGQRINNNLFVGGGIGLRQPLEDDFPAYIPIFVNAKYNLAPSKTVIPMANLSVGVVYNSDDGLKNGGLMVNPGFGVYINSFDKFMLHATIGYDVMHMQFYILRGIGTFNPYIVKKTRSSEAFVFNLGVTF